MIEVGNGRPIEIHVCVACKKHGVDYIVEVRLGTIQNFGLTLIMSCIDEFRLVACSISKGEGKILEVTKYFFLDQNLQL